MRLRSRPARSGLGGKTGREGWERELVKLRRGWGRGFTAPPRVLLPSEVSLLGLSSSHSKAEKLPPLSGHCYFLAPAAAAAAAANSSGHQRATKSLAAILQCLRGCACASSSEPFTTQTPRPNNFLHSPGTITLTAT